MPPEMVFKMTLGLELLSAAWKGALEGSLSGMHSQMCNKVALLSEMFAAIFDNTLKWFDIGLQLDNLYEIYMDKLMDLFSLLRGKDFATARVTAPLLFACIVKAHVGPQVVFNWVFLRAPCNGASELPEISLRIYQKWRSYVGHIVLEESLHCVEGLIARRPVNAFELLMNPGPYL